MLERQQPPSLGPFGVLASEQLARVSRPLGLCKGYVYGIAEVRGGHRSGWTGVHKLRSRSFIKLGLGMQ